jgi:hypothetical protein
MPDLLAMDSPISALSCEVAALLPTAGDTTTPASQGPFAEVMALATSQIDGRTDNVSIEGPGQAWAMADGQTVSAPGVAAKLVTASSPDLQGCEAGDGGDRVQPVSDPVAQVVRALVAGGSGQIKGQASPGNSFVPKVVGTSVSKVGKAFVTPAGNGAEAAKSMAGSVALGEAESCEEGVRVRAGVRQEHQVRGQTGGGQGKISVQEPDGCAVAMIPIVVQSADTPATAEAGERSQMDDAGPEVSVLSVVTPLTVARSEPENSTQSVSRDGRRTPSRPLRAVPASSVPAGNLQVIAAEQPPAQPGTRLGGPGADAQPAGLEQGKVLAGTPNAWQGERPPSAREVTAAAKDGVTVIQPVPPGGKLPGAGEDSMAAGPDVATSSTNDSPMPRENEPVRTTLHPASYELRPARELESKRSTVVSGGAKSVPDTSNGADSRSGRSATVADGHPQASDILGAEGVLERAAVVGWADRSHVAGHSDSVKVVSSRVASSEQSIGRQILDSMQASLTRGEQEITVRLRPPELGNVVVRFKEQDGQLHGLLEVSGDDTRREIERVLPQVLQTLQDQGTHIRRFDVMVFDQRQTDSGKGQWQQEAWARQSWGQGREQLNPLPTYRSDRTTDSFVQESPDAEQAVDVSRGGINVLL